MSIGYVPSTQVVYPKVKPLSKSKVHKTWELNELDRIIQIIFKNSKYLMRVYTKSTSSWSEFVQIKLNEEFFLKGELTNSFIQFNSFGSFGNKIVHETINNEIQGD